MIRSLLLLAAISSLALAQDVPAPPSPSVPAVPGFHNPDDNALAAVGVVVKLAQEGKWAPAVLLGLFLVVWAFRKFALKLIPGAAGDWLRGKWGGWLINFVLALLGGFGSVALVGTPINVGSVMAIVMGSVTFALGAAGVNELLKDIGAKKVAEADAAAAAASGTVTTLSDAAAEMRKGPPES